MIQYHQLIIFMENHEEHEKCESCYMCTGTCGAKMTEEEYDKSQKACSTTGCSHEGMPFEKKMCCDDEEVMPAEEHAE